VGELQPDRAAINMQQADRAKATFIGGCLLGRIDQLDVYLCTIVSAGHGNG
jgi:hypothetical protein